MPRQYANGAGFPHNEYVNEFGSAQVILMGSYLCVPPYQATQLVTVAQSQGITLPRRASKLVSILESELVTVARQFPKVISTLVQAQLVSVIRRASKVASFAQAQLVSIARQTSKVVSLVQTQLVSVARLSGKIVSLVQTELMSVIRQVSKAVSLVQMQLVLATRLTSKAVSFVQAELVSVARQSTKIVQIPIAQSISLVKNIYKFITLNGILSQIFVARQISESETISVSLDENVSLSTRTGISSLTTLGESVSVNRTAPKTVTILSSISATLATVRTAASLIVISLSQTIREVKRVGISKLVLLQEQVSVLRQTSKNISVQTLSVLSTVQQIFRSAIVQVTISPVITLRNALSKLLLILNRQSLVLQGIYTAPTPAIAISSDSALLSASSSDAPLYSSSVEEQG